ncbi:MAG: polyprenyl synthetase family protein [Bacteroidales bacterium]|nr:polyprenyl synthetase family protein [Bacteroidales bacterium]MBQ7873495.1 polyprenyl synthetase family protein [Clostridia bacterium]
MYKDIKDKLLYNVDILEKALSDIFEYNDTDCRAIIEAQKYALLNGGKRIRGFLVMQFCRAFNGDENSALPYACAIEMIHASSLVHDDLPCMDNDDWRRGKPSTHKVFGEAIALLSGDALMVKAFETVNNNNRLTAKSNARAFSVLARSTGDLGMLGGQTMDIFAAKKELDLDSLVRLYTMKTGKLISASAKLGCIASGVLENDDRYKAAVKYAENVGLAFQIIDDILDYRDGKSELNSFLAHLSIDDAKSKAEELTRSGIEAIAPYDDGTLSSLAEYLITRNY